MNLSVIIPLGDMAGGTGLQERLVSLLYALQSFYLKHKDTETIIVAQNIQVEFPASVRVINVEYPVFNKSWLINIGAKAANADYICIAESDMWADRPYLEGVIPWMKAHSPKWCFAWNRLFYTGLEEKNAIIETDCCPLERPTAVVRPTPGYSEGGLLMFQRAFFFSIGMCNEWLQELGGIDNELARRATYAAKSYTCYSKTTCHLWHERVRQRRAPTRLKNVDIYKYVKANPSDTIRVLKKYPGGNMAAPVCKAISFYQARMAK